MKKKKSNSLNCLQESEDSGLGLKGCAIRTRAYIGQPAQIEIREDKIANQITTVQKDSMIIEDFYKARESREYENEAPTLRSDRHGLLVSGQTKLTNTPAKSIEKDSVIKSIQVGKHQQDRIHDPRGIAPTIAPGTKGSESHLLKILENGTNQVGFLKAISEKSPSQIYPTMTFSQVASLVKVFPLREGVKVFKTSQGELFSSKSVESLEVKDRATYSLRMLKDYFLTTQAEPSQLYCFHWMNLGTMSNGRCAILNISFHKTGKGSLSSVLEGEVDEKYCLTKKSWERFIKRDMGKITDGENEKAGCLSIKNQSGQAQWDRGTTLISDSGLHRKPQMRKSTAPPLRANTGGSHNNLLNAGRIRRLTPIECERLQGFPDNWTKGVSDTQRYKMMGNAVSVPVIAAIGKKILESIK